MSNLVLFKNAVERVRPKGLGLRIDQRYIAPLLVTFILLMAQLSARVLVNPFYTLAAILTSMATELVLGRLTYGKWPNLASAYVSGISVGILLRSDFVWPYMLCSAISITSKYAIRVNGRHLWNPSNLGIVATLFIAPNAVSTLMNQFSNGLLPMIVVWVVGSLVIYRLKRFHICLTYVLSFVFYAFLRSLILHDSFITEVAPITGPMYQLFTFFMITDPKTTVHSKRGQMLVAFLVATVENCLWLYGSIASPPAGSFAGIVASHAPYIALTLVGPPANLIEILREKRRKPAQQQADASTALRVATGN